MAIYIVRRLVAAVILLLIVTTAVFAIFYLVPRIAGATPEDLASRYVGKTADAAAIHEIAVKLGFTDSIWVQYGRFLKGLVAGADSSTGATTVHCPAPCFGYSFLTQNPVLPDVLDRLPVTLSLAPWSCWTGSASRRRRGASTTTRTTSPAGCVSAR